MSDADDTNVFNFNEDQPIDVRETIELVYKSLEEKGYKPINQIVGYLTSADPGYIPRHNDARNLIRRHEVDEIVEVLLRNYLNK